MGKKAKKRRNEQEELEVNTFLNGRLPGDETQGVAGPSQISGHLRGGDFGLTDYAVAQMYLRNGVYDFRMARPTADNLTTSGEGQNPVSSAIFDRTATGSSRHGGGGLGSPSIHGTIVTRSSGAQMFSTDPIISRSHSTLTRQRDTTDLESTNTPAEDPSSKHATRNWRSPRSNPAAEDALDSSSSPVHLSPHRPSRSPTPVVEFVPGIPSPEYLQTSLEPSFPCPISANKPKLLILDLNGTLVYRSPRNRRNRTITPRPYMESFTRWVTHPESGLQTMIWSSAQPVNVEKMALACFGEDGAKSLRAIWARDTLGLTQRDYARKVQTVKDLNIVWKKLPFTALDTILLDDSFLKAHLQPYNHLILPEYDSDLCRRDASITQQHLASASKSDPSANDAGPNIEDMNLLEHSGDPDQTLLAVIGILSAAVRQTNVSSWMRAGGLWGSVHTVSQPSPTPEAPVSVDLSLTSTSPNEIDPIWSRRCAEKRKRRSSSDGGEDEDVVADQVGPHGEAYSEVQPPPPQKLWYEDPEVLADWVDRGRAELGRLGIPVQHGLRLDSKADMPTGHELRS
ncbi:hypothetical protein FRB95_013230 [Tulasnella sp. JGI-2019a]|nr:hypothetical protein FRB95_013230 [Tulasnella sp. JGI-2019a]